MRDGETELKRGKRVRLSTLGKQRSPKVKVHTGILVGMSRRGGAVLVLMDGNRTPTTLHRSYIEPHQ
jgi:hypothetical protein